MARGQRLDRGARRSAPGDALPPSQTVAVRALDGTRLHAEVFGPEDGYPIVLAHGITCAIRVWAYQIADLARDYRVIAYDHRGHGRSGLPTRRELQPELPGRRPGRRARSHSESGRTGRHRGPFHGRIAISAWSERYPRRVAERADAVALINTTTGDAPRHVQLAPVSARLSAARVRAAEILLENLGAAPVALPMVSSRHIARMAPNLAEFVELSGGHCATLERPDEVNRRLRWLIESVSEPERATS
jgi:pimeloyl-ACP methyl ester carboxylesterase